MWINLAFHVLGYRCFPLSLFSSTWSCLLRFALPYSGSTHRFQYWKKFLCGVALLTNIYHQIPTTDGNENLFGSYMKKLGIDLSSLVSSLWEFMLAMVSTMLFLPAQNTLLLATTGFLLKPHEQMSYVWPVSRFFGNTVRYHRHRSWDLFSLLNYCSVHTL